MIANTPGLRAAHQLERTATAGPGHHTLTVEYQGGGSGSTFVLDDYVLKVEVYK